MIFVPIVLAIAAMLALSAVWKSLQSGKSQPVSFLLERAGKRAIVRTEAPWQFWYHLAPWLCLAPICAALCAFATIAATTYPTCSDLVRERCAVR